MASPWPWVEQEEHDFILIRLNGGIENVDEWHENDEAVVSWNSEHSSLHIYLVFDVDHACFHVDLRWALIVKLEEVKLKCFGVMPACEKIRSELWYSGLDDSKIISAMLGPFFDLL